MKQALNAELFYEYDYLLKSSSELELNTYKSLFFDDFVMKILKIADWLRNIEIWAKNCCFKSFFGKISSLLINKKTED